VPQAVASAPTVPAVPAPAAPAQVTATSPTSLKEIAPDALPANAIKAGSGKLVIVIGTDEFNRVMMTANAGGSIGKQGGKAVVYTILTPEQPYDALEKADTYTVRFYPTGQSEPSVVLECKRLPSAAPAEGAPRMYVGEIVKAYTR
jgi:acetyl-CoA acetyltransferase